MATYEYANKTLTIYFTEDKEGGSLIQPHFPDGSPWENKAQAVAWAEAFLKALEDPEAPLPGDSPEEPLKPRPVAPETVEQAEVAPVVEDGAPAATE